MSAIDSEPIPINRKNPASVRLLYLFHRLRLRPLFRLWSVVMGVDVAFRSYGDLVMPHPLGIVIHGSTQFGKGVTVYQNVTIASHPRVNRAATVEDDVVICAGAVLVGPVLIGRGAVIAANAVVTSDVPAGATVAGAPARKVQSRRFGGTK